MQAACYLAFISNKGDLGSPYEDSCFTQELVQTQVERPHWTLTQPLHLPHDVDAGNVIIFFFLTESLSCLSKAIHLDELGF